MKDIKFKVFGEDITISPQKMLENAGNSLFVNIQQVYKDFMYVGQLHAKMVSERDTLRITMEAIEGKRYNELKVGGYQALYGTKSTEDALSRTLCEDANVIKARKDHIRACMITGELGVLKRSLEMRMEALKEISDHSKIDKRLSSKQV